MFHVSAGVSISNRRVPPPPTRKLFTQGIAKLYVRHTAKTAAYKG